MKIIQPICLILALTTLLFFATQPIGFSINIPQQISYQGKLMENGVPVNGTKTFTFAFVDTDWHEIHENVRVVNGIYSVVLGSITEIPPQIFENNTQTKMNITVDDIELAPDVDILSVGYAFVAHKAEYAEVANRVSNAIYVNESMSVGIGTDEPTQMLDVRGGIRIGYTEKGSAGSIRYTNTNIEFHDGEKWGDINNNSQWTDDDKGIHYDHNVGIGATNVESKLQVTNLDETKASFLIQQKIGIPNSFSKTISIDDCEANAVDIVQLNNYILVGNAYDKVSDKHMIIIISIDEYGNYILGKTVHTDIELYSTATLKLSFNEFVIVGYIRKDDRDEDIIAIRLDQNANIIWAYSYGGNLNDRAYSVIESKNNEILLAGSSASFCQPTAGSPNRILLLNIDQSGLINQSKTIKVLISAIAFSIIQTNDDGYIICGRSSDTSMYANIMKYTSHWELEWSKQIQGESTTDIGYAISEYNEGYVISGYTVSSQIQGGMLINLSKTGELKWMKRYGENFNREEEFYSLHQVSEEGYIIAGINQIDSPENQFILFKLDPSGEKIWSIQYEYNIDRIKTLRQTNTGYILVGSTKDGEILIFRTDESGYIYSEDNSQMIDFELYQVDAKINNQECLISIISNASFIFKDFKNSLVSEIISKISKKKISGGSPITNIFVAAPNGNIGIGLNDPQYRLHVRGYAYSTGSWGSSDKRWKTNLSPLNNSLNKITLLNGYSFNWDTANYPEMNFPTEPQIGLIAQEVEKIFPKLVHTDDEGYKSVAYDKLTAVLVEALKELNNKNETLSSEIEALKNEIEILKGKL
jgi:hypothetical protein